MHFRHRKTGYRFSYKPMARVDRVVSKVERSFCSFLVLVDAGVWRKLALAVGGGGGLQQPVTPNEKD